MATPNTVSEANKNNPIFIGVDAGTSQIKCVAFTANGHFIGSCSRSNDYKSTPDGGATQSMQATRSIVLDSLTELVDKLGDQSALVKGIAITAQGDGLLLTDRHGEPLHEGWLWLDSRAAVIAQEIETSAHYESIFNSTGTAINAAQMRSQLRWIEQHQPSLLDDAHSALHWKDYLYLCLTGERATDPSEALFTFGDINSTTYSAEVISALKLEHRKNLLPPIVDGLKQSHTLLDNIARQIGLPESIEVTLGYVDVICTALGGGLYNDGQESAMTILGTTGIHMRYAGTAQDIQLPAEKTGYTIAFPGGGFVQLQSNMAATLNLDWILNLACDVIRSAGHNIELPELYESLNKNLNTTAPLAAIFHPYIASAGERGPFVNADARASFIGLEQSHSFYDMVRCVVEGLGFAARDCYEALGELPAEIRITGGAAKSAAIQQIFASIMNRPVTVIEQPEAGAAGAVMIATVKHGFYKDINTCVDQWLGDAVSEPVHPEIEHTRHYEQLYQLYLTFRKSQVNNWSDIATLRNQLRNLAS